MPQWARKIFGFVLGTVIGHYVWPVSESLGEHAVAEWVNHQIAERFGIASPSQEQVIDFAVLGGPRTCCSFRIPDFSYW